MATSDRFPNTSSFTVDGVLFDMDGTLTDSIAAVEAAWSAKADELGLDREEVIAATHGRRASDNLQDLIPNLKKEHVDKEVDKFERSILAFADSPPVSRSGSRRNSRSGSAASSRSNSISSSRKPSFSKSATSLGTLSSFGPMTPVTGGTDSPKEATRRPSTSLSNDITKALTNLAMSSSPKKEPILIDEVDGDVFEVDEEDLVDMSVQILPGVRKLIDSLPKDKYAVATSGAKTYCHGCLERTGIAVPGVCVTADDPRLEKGKPHPDPFLLAAKDLGIDPKKSVIFEDSPSGIKAAVAAGGTVIAVCTSHKREQISHYGAHYIVETMDQVKCEQLPDGRLHFTVAH
ncbi:HAD-like domain-containing protein [Kockovaella imperatae]|uniref:HAD-like domain-containing protein n=1 Tax=Kockovaella imperatae TaxID=4999 RepID=A0A1Y1UN99_9TREE|nr:HAD-like domain-containing protein [Kockovaella imperatae]ORX38997.1 HAD-like domain-containing protein [Kockovaella imperatae]